MIPGESDLATAFPELGEQWHSVSFGFAAFGERISQGRLLPY